MPVPTPSGPCPGRAWGGAICSSWRLTISFRRSPVVGRSWSRRSRTGSVPWRWWQPHRNRLQAAGGGPCEPRADGALVRELIGYADPFSVAPGDTIGFFVSSDAPEYHARLVRLIHGDADPSGPGLKVCAVGADFEGSHCGE